MICSICGNGELASGTTTFATDVGDTVVVVREVPAEVCQTCREAFIADEVAEELEYAVEDARRDGTESLVRQYQPSSAA